MKLLGPLASNYGNLYNNLPALISGCYGVIHDEVIGTD